MKFTKLYLHNGKEIFPRKGMIIQSGTIVCDDQRNFITTEVDMIVNKTKEYNDMGYATSGDWFLIPKN